VSAQTTTRTALPLSEATFFILLSLAAGPHHGYAILKEVGSLSDGRVALSTGTLYGAIKRLLTDRWIQRCGGGSGEGGPGRPRKAYQLTHAGRQILKAESARLQSLVLLARTRVVLEEP